MKIKHLMIVGLMLAILTIGAVSASENVTSDDLAVEDATEEPIEVADEPVTEIADEGEDEILAAYDNDYDNDCFSLGFNRNIIVNDPSGDFGVVGISFYSTITEGWANGTMSFKVNGNWSSFNKTVTSSDAGSTIIVKGRDLGITDYGDYEIEYWWENPSKNEQNRLVLTKNIRVTILDIKASDVYGLSYLAYGDDIRFDIGLPSDATGTLTVTLNGRTYNVDYKNGRGSAIVKNDGLALGDHTAVVAFGGDSSYKPMSHEVPISIVPKIYYPGSINMIGSTVMSVGENEFISVTGPVTASGQANLTIYYYNGTVYDNQNLTISNGYASYSLSDLPKGEFYFVIYGKMDNSSFMQYDDINVVENDEGFSASVTSEITEGGYANVIIDMPPTAMAYISVDGIPIKMYVLSEHIEDMISGLSVGTHMIKVMASDSYNSAMFSKTYTVTVKQKPAPDVIKLTLKKVKVKKSAKKLVLTATLKINGKAVKGKVIKFKFNKKTYSAKTNAKGVAKVTIKKAVLKKLKAGKKITYQATYGKTVKKITVKVLK